MGAHARTANRAGMRRSLVLATALAIGGFALTTGPGSDASFTAASLNPQTISAGTLAAPTTLAAAAKGNNVQVTWNGVGTGYAVSGAPANGSGTCTGVTWSAVGTSPTAAYLDTGRSTPPGSTYCYRVASSLANWTSVASPATAVQIGVVAKSVAITNGPSGANANCSGTGAQDDGTAGRVDCGDQIVVTFNQPINPASGPQTGDSVCVDVGRGNLWLASTATGTQCQTTETNRVGQIKITGTTGLFSLIGINSSRYKASYSWNANNTQLTVTVLDFDGTNFFGYAWVTVNTIGAFTPTTTAANLTSVTGGVHVCTANAVPGSVCLPTATGSF